MNKKGFLSLLLIGLGISCIYLFYSQKSPLPKGDFTRVPVQFLSKSQTSPMMEIEIEGQKYCMEIDLGTYRLALKKEILDQLKNKQRLEILESLDIHGNSYFLEQFILPSIKINHVEFLNIPVKEESIEFLTTGSKLWASPENIHATLKTLPYLDGRIGLSVFQACACFFDLPNRCIYLAKNGSELQKIPDCSLKNFIELPLFTEPCGSVIQVETEIGLKRFVLDTGAEISILKSSLVNTKLAKEFLPGKWKYRTNTLIFDHENLGPWNFILFDISPELGHIDGILGVDFFKKHALIIDYENKKVFIRKHLGK